MTLTEKQQRWIEDWSIIPDSYERLEMLMGEASAAPRLDEGRKSDDWLVPGCQARVWLLGGAEPDGSCRFEGDSDAPMVRALTIFLCRLYSGHPVSEVMVVEPEILERLALTDHLTPTRRNGLRQIRERIRKLAGIGADEG